MTLRAESRHRLPRRRSLKRRSLIRALFDRSRRDVHVLGAGPLTIRYRTTSPTEAGSAEPVLVGFAVGRNIRNKPDRNRIKRILREVYRVHQHALVDLFAVRQDMLTMMILYRGRIEGASTRIRTDLPELLTRVEAGFHPATDTTSS